jgi:hypothetical protein
MLMNNARVLVASIVFLGLGLGLILAYSHDSTIGFTAAHPAAAASLQVVIHTDGWPAMAGLVATAIGVLLLFAALLLELMGQVAARTRHANPRQFLDPVRR